MTTLGTGSDEYSPLLRRGRRGARRRQKASDSTAANRRVRVQIDFSPQAYGRLEEIQELSGSSSVPEMFRTAARLLEWVVRKRKDGYTICVQKDGQTTAIELL